MNDKNTIRIPSVVLAKICKQIWAAIEENDQITIEGFHISPDGDIVFTPLFAETIDHPLYTIGQFKKQMRNKLQNLV